MAIEYGSSPVAHPALQILIGIPGGSVACNDGNNVLRKASMCGRLRKKIVS
jgi:hypothetical protein